jgi:hypothetical protein
MDVNAKIAGLSPERRLKVEARAAELVAQEITMGAWAVGSFENDDALDWLIDLEKSSGLGFIQATLKLSEAKYIESPEGCCIVAAAEVVLALQNRPRKRLPEEAQAWVTKNGNFDARPLNKKAINAIDRVLSEDSELNALWLLTDHYDAWRADVHQIRALLVQSENKD